MLNKVKKTREEEMTKQHGVPHSQEHRTDAFITTGQMINEGGSLSTTSKL